MNAMSILAPLHRRGYVVPVDLAATAGLVVLAWSTAFLPVVRETPLRIPFGAFLVLFLPGYALLAALFPRVKSPLATSETPKPDRLDGGDRVLLAIALSIALTALTGLFLSATQWGFTVVPTALTLGGLTLACCLVGGVRRARLPPADRFSLSLSVVSDATEAAFVNAPRRTRLLNVLLVCGVVVAAGSIAYAAAVPNPTEPFSEFYLLSETGGTEPTTQGYALVPGTSATFRVGVVNHEGTPVDYTVVAVAQQVTVDEGVERVVAQTELERLSLRVAPGETREVSHTIAAETDLSPNQRVAYLLYKRVPPAFPTADTAYRHLFVTVDS